MCYTPIAGILPEEENNEGRTYITTIIILRAFFRGIDFHKTVREKRFEITFIYFIVAR